MMATIHRIKKCICVMICLVWVQPGFGQPVKSLVNDYQKTTRGYFFLNTYSTISPAINLIKGYHAIIDAKGHIVYYKKTGVCFDFKIQPGNLMSYCITDKFYLLNQDFNLIDSVTCKNGVITDCHDFRILPNGHYLLIGTRTDTMDLSLYPLFLKKHAPGSKRALVKCGVIQELDQNKEVVFEWNAKDHFRFDEVDEFFLNDSLNVDWTHFNSIDKDEEGNLLLSVKFFNEITKIKSSDGAVLWRMGGKKNQFRFINDTLPVLAQHDVRQLPNGHITVMDNGHSSDSSRLHMSRALEYEVDETQKTATLVWSFIRKPAPLSTGTGNVQRLVNGNTLVNFGRVSNGNITFELVNSSGELLFDLKFPDTLSAYRSFYYDSLPFHLKRPVIVKIKGNDGLFLDGGPNGPYLWSDRRATRKIRIKKAGAYFVYVPKGNDGGFISSEIINVSKAELPPRKKRPVIR